MEALRGQLIEVEADLVLAKAALAKVEAEKKLQEDAAAQMKETVAAGQGQFYKFVEMKDSLLRDIQVKRKEIEALDKEIADRKAASTLLRHHLDAQEAAKLELLRENADAEAKLGGIHQAIKANIIRNGQMATQLDTMEAKIKEKQAECQKISAEHAILSECKFLN